MSNNPKDVPNGELISERSELQLADIRIRDLEQQLQAAHEEIARLKQEIASSQRPPSS